MFGSLSRSHGFYHEREVEFKQLFLDAESKGLETFEVGTEKQFEKYMDGLKLGQIVEYKKMSDSDLALKNIWEVIEKDEKRIIFSICRSELFKKQKTITFDQTYDEVDSQFKVVKMRPGKFMINSDGSFGRIKRIEIYEVKDSELTHQDSLRNPQSHYIPQDIITIVYEEENDKRINLKNPVFDRERKCGLDEFLREKWTLIEDFNSYISEVKLIEDTKELKGFNDVVAIGYDEEEDVKEEEEATSALVSFLPKEKLEAMSQDLEERKHNAVVLSCGMQRALQLKREEVEAIMEQKKAELALVMQNLNCAIAVFQKQIKKIYRLIDTLEIYYGVNEHIYQISEGSAAAENIPISLRQMKLYMDEEFGGTENGGLDFETIELFDEWLIDSGNYKNVVPEEKCIVVMNPRRYTKDRGDLPPILKARYDAYDKMIYVIIRNGENIYRIWTDNIEFGDRLFPKRDELQVLMEEMFDAQKEKDEAEERGSDYSAGKADEKMDDVEAKVFYYKRNILLLQGIILRTEIFKPLPATLNLLDPSTYDNLINFIYDEENLISDGRIRYKEWLSQINKSIKKGSRIYFKTPSGSRSDWGDRFAKYMNHYPSLPSSGVYEVKEDDIEYTEDKIVEITLREYEEDEEKAKFAKYNKGEYKKKYDKKFWIDDDKKNKDLIIRVCVLDERGYRESEKKVRKQLKILYNPGDTVYAGWGGSFDDGSWSRTRKNNLSFYIKPEHDDFIINYDALLVEDVDYYINNRIDRKNYLKMLPVLKGLRQGLFEETNQEKDFVQMLIGEFISKYAFLDRNVLDNLVKECVQWWKDERPTVYRRPINKNETKALQMIKDEVIRRLKKNFNINVDYAFSNKKKTLFFKHENYVFYAIGLTKEKFIEIVLLQKENRISLRTDKSFSKKKIVDNISETTNKEYVSIASKEPGRVFFNQILLKNN